MSAYLARLDTASMSAYERKRQSNIERNQVGGPAVPNLEDMKEEALGSSHQIQWNFDVMLSRASSFISRTSPANAFTAM
jgi:hypothetical protein